MSKKIIGVTVGTPLSPAKIAEKLSMVKTVNGVSPDENGNVEVKGGASIEELNAAVENVLPAAVRSALQTAKESGAFDGKDGVSPTVEVRVRELDPATDRLAFDVTITDADGDYTFTVKDGVAGKDGYTPVKGVDYFDGADGYTPIKGVDYFDGQNGKDGEKGDPGEQGHEGPQGEKGEKGDPGKDGFSPSVKVESLALDENEPSRKTHHVMILDYYGGHSFNVEDGKKGDAFTYDDFTAEQLESLKVKGDKGDAFTFEDFTAEQLKYLSGADGEDGVSPAVTVRGYSVDSNDPERKAYNVVITDAEGTKDFTVTDGRNGRDGADGTNISKVERISGDGSPGTTDTYGIYKSTVMTDSQGNTTVYEELIGEFEVYNGSNGNDGDKGDPYTLTDADKNAIAAAVKASLTTETWTFTLEDGSTVTKAVYVG